MNDLTNPALMNEVSLFGSTTERERFDNMRELYAVIMSLETLEKVFSRDYISSKEYTAECSKLLTQYKTALKLLPGINLTDFLQKYRVNCPAALARIKEDRPTTVREGQGYAVIADITLNFVTFLDCLKLNIRAVDELFPVLQELQHSLTSLSTLPADFDSKVKVAYWFDKLKGMAAHEEVSEDIARQMTFEIDMAHNSFMRSLRNT